MIFRPKLAEVVMDGRKTVTRRLVSDNPRSPWWEGGCKLVPGRTYAVCPGRGKPASGRVRVLSVRTERLGDVFGDTLSVYDYRRAGEVEARREGFPTAIAFKLAWLAINGRYDADVRVWRVRFERA